MQRKKNQHYVWREYLRSWATNEKIACLREGKFIEPNPNLKNIGQERYFYKLGELSSDDLAFIEYVISLATSNHLKTLNYIQVFPYIFLISEYIKAKNGNNQELEEKLEVEIYNFDEDFHNAFENSAIKYIKSILEEDIEFYCTDDGFEEFIDFLCEQSMRTKKSRTIFLQGASLAKKESIKNSWNIVSHILATNLAWSFYQERDHFKMVLLKNNTEKEFITGDQPVVNTYANLDNDKTPILLDDDEIELYYPVSPKIAILISQKEEYKNTHLKLVNENDVVSYNILIAKESHSQVYATTKSILEEYKPLTEN